MTNFEINSAGELILIYSNNQRSNLGKVIGANGQDGKNGAVGKDGLGIKKTEINALGELVITYTDDTSINLGVIITDNSVSGSDVFAPKVQINAKSNEWEISADGGRTWTSTGVKATGENGTDGKDGVNGKDAIAPKVQISGDNKWQISTDNGSTWISTGVKATGKDGIDGANGQDGKDGLNGLDGTGISGAKIDMADHLILTLSDSSTIDVGVVVGKDGKDGVDGQNGKNGQDGVNGLDGIGIKNVTVSADGILTITLNNETVLTLGNIKGKDGVGIAKSEINADGNLVLTYTDGKVVTLDKVVATNGVGIKRVEITADYMLKLTFDDDSVQTLGPIRGEKGENGIGISNVSVGADGYLYVAYDDGSEPVKVAYIKGDKGETGEAGKTPYIKNGNWWIDGADTGIKAQGAGGADGVSVVDSYVDDDLHLWIVLSNGKKIDAGYVGVNTTTPTTFTVAFKNYDGSILKTETVKKGESAMAPSAPGRNGYLFIGWDNVFENVTADIVVTAQFKIISEPTFMIDRVEASPGSDEVKVNIALMNNPGISSLGMVLSYDKDLTLKSITKNNAVAGTFTPPQHMNNPVKFIWYSPFENVYGDWVFVTLTFKVSDTAAKGEHPIQITYDPEDIYDMTEQNIRFDVINGAITIK